MAIKTIDRTNLDNILKHAENLHARGAEKTPEDALERALKMFGRNYPKLEARYRKMLAD